MTNKMTNLELSELVKTMSDKNVAALDRIDVLGVKTEHIFVQKGGAKYAIDVPMPLFKMAAQDMKGGVHKGLISIWQVNDQYYEGFIYTKGCEKVGFWNWGCQYPAPIWRDYKTKNLHKGGLFQCWLRDTIIPLVSTIWG